MTKQATTHYLDLPLVDRSGGLDFGQQTSYAHVLTAAARLQAGHHSEYGVVAHVDRFAEEEDGAYYTVRFPSHTYVFCVPWRTVKVIAERFTTMEKVLWEVAVNFLGTVAVEVVFPRELAPDEVRIDVLSGPGRVCRDIRSKRSPGALIRALKASERSTPGRR